MANRIRSAPTRALPARALALVVSLLAACGGSSGGGGGPAPLSAPSTPVSLTAANGAQVAANVLQIATGVGTVTGVVPIGVEVELDAQPTMRVVSRIGADALRRATRIGDAAPSVTGAVQTQPCYVSGSVSVSESGSSFAITFNQCSDYAGEVINGTLAMTDVSETGDAVSGSGSGNVSIDLTVTEGGATMRIVGGFRIVASWSDTSSSITVTGTYLGYTDGVVTHVLSDFSFSDAVASGLLSSSSHFTLASTAIGGSVTVSMPTPFKAYELYYPHQGELLVTGAGGGQIRLLVWGNETAASPQVEIGIDADGDGDFETLLYRDWYELAAE